MKKIAIGVLALLLIIGAGLAVVWSGLDHAIKVAIEKYGSASTQTEVSLDTVKLSLASGEGKLDGLNVGNPKGFSSAKAFQLGQIAVKVDISSIKGSGPIVIKEVVIDKPRVTFELANDGTTNLKTIEKNAQAYANALTGGGKSQKQEKTAGAEAPGRKVIIKNLIISNGMVSISQESLKDKQFATTLPSIHLTNIGQQSNGATAAEVARQVIDSISSSAAQVALSTLAKEKISGALGAVPGAAIGGAAVNAVGDKVGKLFDQ